MLNRLCIPMELVHVSLQTDSLGPFGDPLLRGAVLPRHGLHLFLHLLPHPGHSDESRRSGLFQRLHQSAFQRVGLGKINQSTGRNRQVQIGHLEINSTTMLQSKSPIIRNRSKKFSDTKNMGKLYSDRFFQSNFNPKMPLFFLNEKNLEKIWKKFWKKFEKIPNDCAFFFLNGILWNTCENWMSFMVW